MHVCFLGDAHRVRLYLPYRPQIPPFITNATDQTCKNSHRAVSSLLQTGKAKKRRNCPNAEKNTLQSPNIPPIPKRCQTTPQHPTATPPNHCQKESIQKSKTGKHPSKPAGQSLTFAQTRAHTTTPQITPSSGPHSIAPFTTVHSKYRADKNNYTHLGKKRSVTLCLQ